MVASSFLQRECPICFSLIYYVEYCKEKDGIIFNIKENLLYLHKISDYEKA